MTDLHYFAVVGRKSVGKSTLIDAISNKNHSHITSASSEVVKVRKMTIDLHENTIQLLDTIGFGEQNIDWKEALQNERPDILLFLIAIKDVDSNLREDLKILEEMLSISTRFEFTPSVLFILTQCDLVSPPDVNLNGVDADGSVKVENIKCGIFHLETVLEGYPNVLQHSLGVIPIASKVTWNRKGKIRSDYRWNIERLKTQLCYLQNISPSELNNTTLEGMETWINLKRNNSKNP